MKNIEDIRNKMPKIGVLQEFKDFLKEYKVVGVAVAFIMASLSLVYISKYKLCRRFCQLRFSEQYRRVEY